MKPGIWCPQCGPGVAVDEDGCCATCGATATGEGADRAAAMAGAFPKMLEALESVEHPVTPEGGDMGLCAACGMSEIRDHIVACKVGDALRAAREAVKP